MTIIQTIKNIFNQSAEERIKMITDGKLHSTFLLIALPGIITMIVQSVMPVLDGLIVYNYDSPISGAAIGYVNGFQNIIITAIAGISTASAGVIGKVNGQGNFKKAMHLSGQLLSLTLISSIIFIPVAIIFMYCITLNQPDLDFKNKVLLYNSIVILALPFISLQTSYNSIKSVFGHPEMALIRILLFVPLKLLCSYIFLVKLNLGIIGASLATVVSYLIISVFIIYDLVVKKSEERFLLNHFKLFKSDIIMLYHKFWPSIVQNSTKSLSFFLIRMELVKYGALALSISGISGDLNQIFFNFTACYDAAIVSFVSVNVGANNPQRAKKAADFAIKLGFISAIFLGVLSHFIAPIIVPFYTDDPYLIENSIKTLEIYNVGILAFSIMFNEMPVFTGLGLTKVSLIIQFMRIWVVRIIAMYVLYFIFKDIGFFAVFWSLAIANIIGGITSHIFYKKIDWKSFKQP